MPLAVAVCAGGGSSGGGGGPESPHPAITHRCNSSLCLTLILTLTSSFTLTLNGGCDPSACSSKQYSFSEGGWTIAVDAALARGKAPYRAFAYLPFCGGSAIGSCVSGDDFSFAVSFKTEDFAGWGAYSKLLFWTDSGNILGHPANIGMCLW